MTYTTNQGEDMNKTKCCICDKELDGINTFGPILFPVCYPHYAQFSNRLNEIAAMPRSDSDKQEIEILVLRGDSKLSPNTIEIRQLENKIDEWEDKISYLKDEIDEWKDKIGYLKNEIDDYQLKARNARDEIYAMRKRLTR